MAINETINSVVDRLKPFIKEISREERETLKLKLFSDYCVKCCRDKTCSSSTGIPYCGQCYDIFCT